MEAQFWIEAVEFSIDVPAFEPGQPPLTIPAVAGALTGTGRAPRTIKVTALQIQHAQQAFLNFNGLTWPHVSVPTLVSAAPSRYRRPPGPDSAPDSPLADLRPVKPIRLTLGFVGTPSFRWSPLRRWPA